MSIIRSAPPDHRRRFTSHFFLRFSVNFMTNFMHDKGPCVFSVWLIWAFISNAKQASWVSAPDSYGELVSQHDWYHLLKEKSGFWGTCLSWWDVRGRIYEGCMGEVANRVSGGSFRWGRWGYLPFRHHDNRYSADWIRLYPGLSKNSEDGNSCPKSHKAARFDWSCGKSGQQWDWDYKPEYGCHHDEINRFSKWNLVISEIRMDKENELWKFAAVRPKSHNN